MHVSLTAQQALAGEPHLIISVVAGFRVTTIGVFTNRKVQRLAYDWHVIDW